MRLSHNHRWAIWPVLLCLPLMLTGCGMSDDAARIPATGTVSLDGRPLEYGNISFSPRHSQSAAATTRIVDGQFRFTEENGLMAGLHDVLITQSTPEFEEVVAVQRTGGKLPLTRVSIPEKYRKPGTLQMKLTPGEVDNLEFALTSR